MSTKSSAKRPRTKGQNSLMFALANQVGVTHNDLKDWTFEITNGRTEHTSELYYSEAVKIIDRLQSYVKKQTGKVSQRTIQYRRQQAGIKQIVTQDQLDKIQREWKEVEGRTPSGLESLCFRILKYDKPRTTADANKVIEAIKSMNKRAQNSTNISKGEAA